MIRTLSRALIAACLGLAGFCAPAIAGADGGDGADGGSGATSPQAKLEKARADAAANRWEEAARSFHDVAMNNPGTDEGRAAVEPYLRAMNALAMAGGSAKTSAWDAMGRAIGPLMRLYCDGVKLSDQPEPCKTLVLARRDLAIATAPMSVMRPTPAELERRAMINKATWDEAGAAICAARQTGYEAMGAILGSAADDFEAAGKPIQALVLRKTLVDPRFHLEWTGAYGHAMMALGEGYEAFTAYEMALPWYEKLAQTSPNAREAPFALERAVELRLLLGDAKEARQDAELFEKHYKKTQPDVLGRIILRIAEKDAANDDWKAVQKGLDGQHHEFATEAGVGEKIRTSALAARASVTLGDMRWATHEYNNVIRAWKEPAKVVEAIGAQLNGRKEMNGRKESLDSALAAAINAHGEALFFFAEQKRKAALDLPLPTYKGPDKREPILRFITTTIGPWMRKKRDLIEGASDAYAAILHIEPEPPPKWITAAAARVGFLWANFAIELKSGPTTPEMRRRGPIPGMNGLTYEELRAEYESQIQSMTEPFLLRAKEAFRVCVNMSTKFAFFDESSIACERWLAKTFPREHHALEEIRGGVLPPPTFMRFQPATPE